MFCSAEKAKAASTQSASDKIPSLEVAAIVPVATVYASVVPVAAPELYVTDSGPPRHSPSSVHLLRAPPMLRA